MSDKHRVTISVSDPELDQIIQFNYCHFDPPLPLATVCLCLLRRGLLDVLASDVREKK